MVVNSGYVTSCGESDACRPSAEATRMEAMRCGAVADKDPRPSRTPRSTGVGLDQGTG
jgi:hypothetical protein